jgi:hypothetical protein
MQLDASNKATIFPPLPSLAKSEAVVIDHPTVDGTINELRAEVAELKATAARQQTRLDLLEATAVIQRARFLNSVMKTTTEAFLSLFHYAGKNRKAFVQNLRLPEWVVETMPKEDLVWEVENRCVESPENTTHRSNGSDALQTIIEAYDSDIIEEEEFTRLTFMLISVYKGASADKPPLLEGRVSNIFKDEERLYDLLADMVDDKGWELRPRRPQKGPGTKPSDGHDLDLGRRLNDTGPEAERNLLDRVSMRYRMDICVRSLFYIALAESRRATLDQPKYEALSPLIQTKLPRL